MPRIERLQQNTAEWHRWRQQGLGASDAPVIMGEAAFKTPRMLWSIKTGRMQEDAAGPAARVARAGAARAAGLRAGGRHPDGAALPGTRPTRMDACIARRAELRRLNRARDQVPHECARPVSRSTGKRASAVLRATAARARGLGGGGGPLLVVRWQRREAWSE